MDTGKMLIPLSVTIMKKVATYHSLFRSDLVCSDTPNAYIWLEIDFGIILKNSLIIHCS